MDLPKLAGAVAAGCLAVAGCEGDVETAMPVRPAGTKIAPIAPGTRPARAVRLAGLEKSAQWECNAPGVCEIGEGYGRLKVSVLEDKSSPTARVARMTLKQPVKVPEKSELFVDATMWNFAAVKFQAVVRDAKGDEYLVDSTSSANVSDGKRPYYFGGEFRPHMARVGETRVHFPGMRLKAKLGRVHPAGKVKGPVKGPLEFVGFEFGHERTARHTCDIYLRNFRFTDADYTNEPFYCNFNTKEHFGTADGAPRFSANLVDAQFWGEKLVLDWELLASGDGAPVAAGSRTIVRAKGDETPFVFLDDPKEEIKIRNEGSYWLRLKAKGNYRDGAPTRILEHTVNYDVLRGEPEKKLPPMGAEERLGEALLRIAPERDGLVWGEDEPWTVPARVWDSAGCTLRMSAANNAGDTLLTEEFAVTASPQRVEFDLTKLRPGALVLTAEAIDAKGRTVDRTVRRIGKRAPRGAGAEFAAPAFPDWKAYAENKTDPLTIFSPMIHDLPRAAEAHLDIMDEMKKQGMVKTVEVQLSWKFFEPVEGAYDFSAIDKILDRAEELGFGVFVTFAPMGVPQWMPPVFTMNEQGYTYGQGIYLHRGGRVNVFHAPWVREKFLAFSEAFVRRVRGRKSLQGYLYIAEHCDEAPWAGWYEGWDEFTLANFRGEAKRRYGEIAKANAAWGTAFASFAEALPPDPREEVPSRYRYDWLKMKLDTGIDGMSRRFVKMVRSLDPHRILMHYENAPEGLEKYGLMTANGGCDGLSSMYVRSEVAERGMPQRMEEHSCSNWKAKGETQVDTSLFNMMAGGGANAHVKMFTPQFVKLDKFRETGRGLDRYEKFIPIFRELAGAERVAGEVAAYHKTAGRWVKNRSAGGYGNSYGGWDYEVLLENQIAAITSGSERWKRAKLVIVCPGDKILLREEADELKAYVRSGGTLFMNADCGSGIIGEDGKEFALLTEFGFPKPELFNGGHRVEIEGVGEVWRDVRAKACGYARADGSMGETLMKFGERCPVKEVRGRPALTVKPFGKGRVYVMWSSTMTPYNREKVLEAKAGPLTMVAKEAGAKEWFRTDSRKLWYNLLKKGETYYLLLASDTDMPKPASVELALSGEYGKWTEIISGKKAKTLEKVQLKAREVQVWRIERGDVSAGGGGEESPEAR